MGSTLAYWLVKVVLTPVLLALYTVRREGTHHVPRRGPVILAANHQSFIDSIFIPLVLPRKVTFVAKAEYFENPKTAWFFRAVGMIPVKRGTSEAQGAMEAAREVLRAGGAIGIYPEGTRSPDGRLYRGHTGAARLAMETGAPVVPVALFGTREVQPIGALWPRVFKKVRVVMGPPLRFSASPGDDPARAAREATEQIMDAIARLSGQERVDEYCKRAPGEEVAGAQGDGKVPSGPSTAALPWSSAPTG